METAHSANPFGRRRLCRVCKKWNRLLNSARLTTWTEIGISIRETSSAQEISRGLENLRNILPNISQLVRDHLVVQACASRSQLMLFSDVEWDEEEPRADVFLIQLLRAIPAAHRPFCDLTLEQRQSFPQHVASQFSFLCQRCPQIFSSRLSLLFLAAVDDQANVRDLLRSVPIRNATLSDDIVWLFLCCVNAAALPNFLMHISPSSLGRPGGSSLQNGEIGELYWFLRTMNICVGVRDEFWLPLEGLMEHLWCIPVFGGCTDPMSAARNPHHQGWHEA